MPDDYEIIRCGWLPKQFDFIHDDKFSWLLYSGALAAGKTRALCFRAVRLALRHPSARVGLARVSLVSLKRTTLVTMLEADGENPPILPPGTYTRKKSAGELEIQLNGGGKIIPFGCDNPEAFGSLNLSDLCIDEGIELDEAEWNMLDGRVRIQYFYPYHADAKPGERRKGQKKNKNTIAIATNPGSPNHFLYKLFYRQKLPHARVIQTKTAENFFLPRDFIPRLSSHYVGPARQRYLDGVWCATEGAVYPDFAPQTHVFHDPGPWDHIVVGVDYGFTHNSAIRVWGVRKKGKEFPRCHCLAEEYRRGATSGDIVNVLAATQAAYEPSRIVVDQNAPDLIEQIRRAGMYAVPGSSGPGDVLPGIRCVGAGLAGKDESGSPRISFETGLKGTDEYMSYRWKPDAIKEEPIKRNDDALDADRYALVNIHQNCNINRLYFGDGDASHEDFHGITNTPGEVDPMLDPRMWEVAV